MGPVQAEFAVRFKRNQLGAVLIALVGATMCVWTWDKSPDPVIDFGRECYVPWRITAGEVLYRDINYFNGPLSPYFNAGLFKLFGTSLRTLKAANVLIVAIATMLIYSIIAGMS